MKAPAHCIVLQAGVPCALVPITSKKRGAALMPGTPIAVFTTRRRARSAVARTQRMAQQLSGSILDQWPKLKALFSGAAFTIEPIAKP